MHVIIMISRSRRQDFLAAVHALTSADLYEEVAAKKLECKAVLGYWRMPRAVR
jgi:hypothetical protein